MNFIDALGYLYHNRTSDEEFTDPFLLYCRLSDLCKSSYEGKRKVLLFYQVDKKINLIKAILNKDNSIQSRYSEVEDLLSEASFQRLVESIKCVIFPEYKRQEKPKTAPKKQATAQAVVEKSEEPEETETRTPLTYSYGSSGDYDWLLGLAVLVVPILLVMGLIIHLACVFDWSWTFWQWFIGIAGGVLLVAILGGIVAWFNEDFDVDYYVLGTMILGLCILFNFILVLICKDYYKIIFGCFSVLELICGIIVGVATFDEMEEGWGVAQIIEIVLTVIFFIIAMIWI